jgi:hypothetical protein
MYMKVFPHGKGNGDTPTRYLVRLDYPGRQENPPEVLRGDPDMTRDLINSIDRQWKFTAGVLSWHPDDMITPEQEERVMSDFEALAFAGLEPDQRTILWVRHSHAGHHELHFVIPRLDLASGKDFNPCPPGWQKYFDVFRDLHNHREGWARPDDPARARLHTPEHADLHRARLIRWGKTPGKDERAEAKNAIHTYLAAKMEQGLVRNREDVLFTLREAGLEINRAGKEYITVKDPESGEKLRLKGGMYAEHWTFAHSGRTAQSQDGEGRPGDREPDPETVRELERELVRLIESRAAYNRKRYPQQYRGIGEEHHFSLSEHGTDLQPEVPVFHLSERRDSDDDGVYMLGADYPVPLPDYGLATGNSQHQSRENGMGQGFSADSTILLRSGTVSGGREELSAPAGRPDGQNGRDGGQTGSLGNREEINHDRTRTDAQGYADPHGAGFFHRLDQPGQNPGGTAPRLGRAEPELAAASGTEQQEQRRVTSLDAAIGRFGRVIQELGTALVAFERYIERQIERARERERSRWPRLG